MVESQDIINAFDKCQGKGTLSHALLSYDYIP